MPRNKFVEQGADDRRPRESITPGGACADGSRCEEWS
jgi:hypothetical protein